MTAAIIEYGMGNVASVQKALNVLGIDSQITGNTNDIKAAKYIILPGVGSFAQGMENLRNSSLDRIIREEVLLKQKPFLGICLGMQLIATTGTEPHESHGLNLIEGKVIKIQDPNTRVPHLGWNSITSSANLFFDNFNQKDFYFIHSYHFQVSNYNKIGATVDYGNKYVAAIQYENILATQFHPEKSQENGLNLLDNFFKLYA
ncbi:imidazole glycerol phosphate synthase subunit HisH [Runella limosa]|uniref:imidazole glycerol phosphate synthase subunit HisH n=1 Tax=Runella limosa TaxID=370978 RepID=UPI000400B39A|nr:imidazole glycerol phosphate synthase subunit HisH [Runella limosa]